MGPGGAANLDTREPKETVTDSQPHFCLLSANSLHRPIKPLLSTADEQRFGIIKDPLLTL